MLGFENTEQLNVQPRMLKTLVFQRDQITPAGVTNGSSHHSMKDGSTDGSDDTRIQFILYGKYHPKYMLAVCQTSL